MNPGIQFFKAWFDEHVIKLGIRVSDSDSRFTNSVYVGLHELTEAAEHLEQFGTRIHNGAFDLQLGSTGGEDSSGSFRARFQFSERGRLLIACEQESSSEPFAGGTVERRASLYLQSEPALLDRFVVELRALASGESDEAVLEAV